MVAPNGTVNEDTLLLTPMRCSTVLMVTGMVAPLDAVLNASANAGRSLLKKVLILRPVKALNIIE
ncbi:MAG: Uncharacterised protein [Cellvibrionales bacterium UBA7375]|nr:MAG: Uncharacterised protein [Cellvibrionales bacterium UBA7375]